MDCDYCGLATGRPARWQVTAGMWPGDGLTRYVCDQHLADACRHVSSSGDLTVTETGRSALAVAA